MFSKLPTLCVILLFAAFVTAAASPNRLPRDVFTDPLVAATEAETDAVLEVTEEVVNNAFSLAGEGFSLGKYWNSQGSRYRDGVVNFGIEEMPLEEQKNEEVYIRAQDG
ncbi:hypothetical protein GSI_06072 [Ganoderma sinense ZZ0214-1]|uniref:Uncharacterized protein n=1 Tax=Ganoderma sinense ZZ0214-1 TaxID=1077348 RepID=A0A2G8SCA7_9APHY|nr:hypothetical protein GSI_06072 [Ganoderma sinense ZZ0214-1]